MKIPFLFPNVYILQINETLDFPPPSFSSQFILSCRIILSIHFNMFLFYHCSLYNTDIFRNYLYILHIDNRNQHTIFHINCILRINAIAIIVLRKSMARPKNWQFNGIYRRQQHASAKISPPQNCNMQFCGGFSRLSVPIAAYRFVKLLVSLPRIRYNSCKSTPFYEVRL